VEAYRVPYLDVIRLGLLPPNMTAHLSKYTARALSPNVSACSRFRSVVISGRAHSSILGTARSWRGARSRARIPVRAAHVRQVWGAHPGGERGASSVARGEGFGRFGYVNDRSVVIIIIGIYS
jgi:hypothetical protein